MRWVMEVSTDWTKRRDLCGRLISEGGSIPRDTFEYRRQAIKRMVREGLLEERIGERGAVFVRVSRWWLALRLEIEIEAC